MISGTITRRLDKHRREVARGPLAVLLQWVLVRACRPHLLRNADPVAVSFIRYDAARILREVADAGAFRYFGLPDALALGSAPIGIAMVRGHLIIQYEPLIEWIFGGGAAGQGWQAPNDLNLLED